MASKFFHWFGKERIRALEFICSDIWRPYLKVITKKATQTVHILDRFHIMSMLSKATESQDIELRQLLQYEPRSVRSSLLKEDFPVAFSTDSALASCARGSGR